MESKKSLLLLVDGNALIHRAFHALPPLTVPKTGEIVGAVYGFSVMLVKAINELKPTHYAIAFDRKAPTFRHQLYNEYKAHRLATPDELVGQFGRVREVVNAFCIPSFEMDGYEADDILGALSTQASRQGIKTVILTGDADMMQLVSTNVEVYYPRPGGSFSDAMLYDEEAVKKKYGVSPFQIADLKALKGDPSDNIPGVPGVGDKTALKLVLQFGSVEQMLEHLDEVEPPKLKEKLKENIEAVKQSHVLATIVRETPVVLDFDKCCQSTCYNRNRVAELFRLLGFNSLLAKLPTTGQGEVTKIPLNLPPVEVGQGAGSLPKGEIGEGAGSLPKGETGVENWISASAGEGEKKTGEITEEGEGSTPKVETNNSPAAVAMAAEVKYQTISSLESLDELIKRLASINSMAISTAGSNIGPMSAQIVGISLSPAPGEAYYIPVSPPGSISGSQLPLATVISRLKPLLESTVLAKVVHNSKFDMILLAETGINLANLSFDTMLAAYLMGDKSLSLKDIIFNRIGIEMVPSSSLVGSGSKQIPLFQVEVEQVSTFACANADMTGRLTPLLKNELLKEEGLWDLFSKLELPLVPVLAHMERSGVLLDTELLKNMSQRLGDQLAEIQNKIYASAGHEFNINSPMQLGVVLFEELHIPGKKVKGKYSTDASILEDLLVYPIVKDILEYRQLMKLKSTYIDALPCLINPRTGRVHTSFNQTRTTTGRLSSSEPNLQNIPVKGELGREIRRAFIAPPGSILIAGDYSQIDLRVLAHLSRDENLVNTFIQDKDIHAATAAQLFGVDISEVKPDQRRFAKTVNFGVIYGMSEFGLEQATELSRKEAGQFIAAYFEKYPGVTRYMEGTREQARRSGYVQTLLGHRRYVPDVNSPNRVIREAAERMAVNMPVQGTSSDIIKVAMINIHNEMVRRGVKSRMLLQVHDELIFEVPTVEVEEMTKLIREMMSAAVQLCVPVKVDIKSGPNWGAME